MGLRVWILVGLAACSARKREPHAADPTLGSLGDASSDAHVDANVDVGQIVTRDTRPVEDAGAEPACAPNEPFAEALRVGAVLSFWVDDSVDPHSTNGGDVRSKSAASLRVSELRCEAGMTEAVLEWVADDGSSIPAQLPSQWRVTGGTLTEFTGESTFKLSELLHAKKPLCHLSRDKGPYGPTLRRVCIDKKGLFSLREENLSGPRVITLTRK